MSRDVLAQRTWDRFQPDKPDDFFITPDAIAKEAFHIAHQDRSAWSFNVEIRPFGDVSSTEAKCPSPQPLSRWEKGLKSLIFRCSSHFLRKRFAHALREREAGRVRVSNSRFGEKW